MNLFAFAFRNVFRNKKRSLLTASSVFFAALVSAFMIGFINGMMEDMVKGYVNYQTGDVKVTSKNYAEQIRFMPVEETAPKADEWIARIKAIPGVAGVEERIPFGILLGKDDDTVPAVGVGLDLVNSRVGLSEKIISGKLTDGGIFLGKQLASRLGVKVGDSILLATKTSEGGLNGIKLKVGGVLNFGISMLDRKFFYTGLQDARRLLKIKSGTTEIFVFADRKADRAVLAKSIRSVLPASEAAVLTPAEQVGSYFDLLTSARYIYYLLALFVIFLATFVLVNTMVMAVYERIREIGTLKSIGMTDRQVFLNFTLEGAILGSLGGIPGAVLGYLLVAYYSVQGIVFAGLENLEMPIRMKIYPSMGIEVLVATLVMAIGMSMLAAMFPARRSNAFSPAEALRKI
jgi:putative ABC transport system permease protein